MATKKNSVSKPRARRKTDEEKRPSNVIEIYMAAVMDDFGIPARMYQYLFARPERQWEADFAWPDARLIVEIDGALYTQGRHVRGDGREKDMERDNWCVMHGWRVLRFSTGQVRNDPYRICDMIIKALQTEVTK